MNRTPIYISREDYTKLRLLLASALRSRATAALQQLREELDRAVVTDPTELPRDAVTMDSTVEFEDLETSEVDEYTITFPDRADVERKRMSILAPVATALIGCRVNDVVEWSTPGGNRQLKVRRVIPADPAPAAPAAARSVFPAIA